MASRNRKDESKQPGLTIFLTSKLSALNDSAGHPFIRLHDDAGDLPLQSVMSQKSAEGLPVNAVERLYIVEEVDIRCKFHSRDCFQNDHPGLRSDPCTISTF
ncbi:hypothetical protein DPMN_193846 [Dreissena polymorpha]|uniref:Uncharacterized protein n=1 Tax=Dreissena polymorpha TaxID=45954 RepID=A0A9D4BF15_DREPO|nr:hypothetical protein DPMN_193846 [Dreissena polymorpha]